MQFIAVHNEKPKPLVQYQISNNRQERAYYCTNQSFYSNPEFVSRYLSMIFFSDLLIFINRVALWGGFEVDPNLSIGPLQQHPILHLRALQNAVMLGKCMSGYKLFVMRLPLSSLRRGFLPEPDPLTAFPAGSPYAVLDQLGRDLPSLLQDADCRRYLDAQYIPEWQHAHVTDELLPQLMLYNVRLGFIASGYVNQVGQEPSQRLPANLAVPLVKACRVLARPPILSYDGYALHNWKRFDPQGPIALGNIDTIQNFVHLYDEHWFILVHIEIEALAANIIAALAGIETALTSDDRARLAASLQLIAITVGQQVAVLKRIPEKMAPELYYRTFRPYIRFFEDVEYEGISQSPISYRGETGAQSSIMPLLVALMKIPHQPSALTNHLLDMRQYMPSTHRQLIEAVAALPSLRDKASPEAFNQVLEAMAEFREVHYSWAQQYIDRWVSDPRGTGGTPYMKWLKQLINETRDWRI